MSESDECFMLYDVADDPPHLVVRHEGYDLPHRAQQANLHTVGNLLRPITLCHRLLTWKQT